MGYFGNCCVVLVDIHQTWESRMEKSAEKWGPGGRRRPPVGVQGATPPVGVRRRSPLKLSNKNKT